MIDTDVERGPFWPVRMRMVMKNGQLHLLYPVEAHELPRRREKSPNAPTKKDGPFTRHVKEKLGISTG